MRSYAQAPQGGYYPPPAGAQVFQPPYATNDPAALYPPALPQTYQPWPSISPYSVGNFERESHENRGGLWFFDAAPRNREYFFSVEALSTHFAPPGNGRIGSPTPEIDLTTGGLRGYTIDTYGVGELPGNTNNNNNANTATTPGSRANIDNGVYPYPFLHRSANLAVTPVAELDNDVFPIRNLSYFGDFDGAGIQTRWGFMDGDGTGLMLTGWWGAEESQQFRMGDDIINGIPLDDSATIQNLVTQSGGILLFTKNGAIPLDNGLGPVNVILIGGNGNEGSAGMSLGTQKYDLLYSMDVSVEAGGADLAMYLAPVISTSSVKVRPLYGARYLYLKEGFAFHGIDSGFGYDIDTGATGNQQQGAGATFRPDSDLFLQHDAFNAFLDSNVESQIAGPQLGFRFDLGSSKRGFHVWGQSILGLLANYEELEVRGENIGEVAVTNFVFGINMLDFDTRFSDRESHTHLSPMFEQSFFAEAPVLKYIPYVNKIPFIGDSMFRVGYTATIVGSVARPGESIDWAGFPEFPSVKATHSAWWAQNLSFAIERRY